MQEVVIFSKCKEPCEVLLDYPTIGWEYIKYYVKKSIRNHLHANFDVHSRWLISEFAVYKVRCISKNQSRCANIIFPGKSIYDRLYKKITHKGEESAVNYIKILQNAQALSVSVGNTYPEEKLMRTFLDNCH